MADFPTIDFSAIGELPAVFRKAQMEQGRKQALEKLGTGASVTDISREMFKAGDIEGGLSLAKLGDAQAMREYNMKTDQRDFAHRVDESQRAQANSDRSFGLQEQQFKAGIEGAKVPAGWRPTPSGGLAPVPEGPADPVYLQKVADAKAKPREFSVTDVTKLAEEGGKFSNLTGFVNTFEPRFAGYGSQFGGNLAMTAGRYAPSLTPKDTADASKWWQGYDRFKNVVRNELFGASLTKGEKDAFDQADINPGQSPETIKANLALQKQVVENGLKKKANALIQSGYDPKAISAAYGLNLQDLGVSVEKRQRTPGAAPGPGAEAPKPRPTLEAVNQLRTNPRLAEQFDEYYGIGSSARVLGVMR